MEFYQFLQYLQFEKRYSVHTLTSYQKDLEQFSEFVKTQYDCTDLLFVQTFMIRSWFVGMMENQMQASSIRRKGTALRSFYKYLLREGRIDRNPVIGVVQPKMGKKLPVFFQEEDLSNVLDIPEFCSNFKGVRNRLMIEILYQTGMRLSEMIRLNESDVDMENCTFKVFGKRSKERIIPFGPSLRKLILLYQDFLRKEGFKTEALLVIDKGDRIYPKFVYRVVKEEFAKISTLRKKSPHVLRHTFATHMLNKGADINAVKELLGHASLQATQVYTHNTVEKLKNIYKQAHPRA